MPAGQILRLAQEVFVILPDANDGGSYLDNSGQIIQRYVDLCRPLGRSIVPVGFVEPVTVQDGEVDLIRQLIEHCVQRREPGSVAGTQILIVATPKLEAEIEQAPGIQLCVSVVFGSRQGSERSAASGRNPALAYNEFVVVAGVGLQPRNVYPVRIVVQKSRV